MLLIVISCFFDLNNQNAFGKSVEFMDAMLADLRAHGERLEGVTARDILSSGNTLSVDIGEGTVNFPVFQGSRFNPDASKSYNHGYGNSITMDPDSIQKKQNTVPAHWIECAKAVFCYGLSVFLAELRLTRNLQDILSQHIYWKPFRFRTCRQYVLRLRIHRSLCRDFSEFFLLSSGSCRL